MAVTIYDVARHASVGIGTVSRVLNGSSQVKDSTREKVMKAMKALEYRPHGSARALASQRTRMVAVMLPHFNGYFFVDLLKGIQTLLCAHGYQMILSNVDHPEKVEAYLEKLLENRNVDGLILCSLGISDDFVDRFEKLKLNVVLVDSFHKALDSIVVDNRAGAYQATEFLIQQGHTHIGMITGLLASIPAQTRFEGYMQALNDHHIPFREEDLTISEVVTCADGFSKESGYHAMKNILTRKQPLPSAFFVSSDEQAAGVMLALKEADIQVPQHVSIVGFDDVEIAEYMGLTTVRQPITEIGKAATQMLLERIDGDANGRPVQFKSYKTELVIRESCRSIRTV